ncbi:MAG: GspE/PulE family protein [Pseudanabaenaceae cyanobacterium]
MNSVWHSLRTNKISCAEALQQLVSADGALQLELLDKELERRFFSFFVDWQAAPPVIPLLLWRNCFYLGCPRTLTTEEIVQIKDRTFTEVEIIPISPESYRFWYRRRIIPNQKQIQIKGLIDPLTGELAQISAVEATDLYLAQAESQTHRINALIAVAMQHRASDIHLEPTQQGLRVRFRIDGILRDIKHLPSDIGRKIIVALKVMSDMDIADSRRPQDGRIGKNYISAENLELNLDMRVSTIPCVCGEKAVIRLLPKENPFSNNLSALGFTPAALAIYESWLHQPQGLIIMTGPTGSGKTSTLYTSLQAIATEMVNVSTIEDPVEYVLPNITQTQVLEAAGMTFAAGLRAILRQDPDIVMVGEVRDPETAETVVRAALTGHLVLSTMHTNDAASAIPRLKDLGPDPGLISDALLGIVAQRLVRKVCTACAVPYVPSPQELKSLCLPLDTDTTGWRRGLGCDRCFGTGYYGREAIVELLDVDDALRELIYEGTITQINKYLNSIDFHSFRRAALDKLHRGITTPSEILRVLPRSAILRTESREKILQAREERSTLARALAK